MKKIITLFIVLASIQLSATNWYTCTGGTGNYSTTLGGTCSVGNINLNNATDTVFILAGATRSANTIGNGTNGVVMVYGTLDIGNTTFNINSNGRLLIQNGGALTANGNGSINNNGILFVAPNATLETGTGGQADLTINGNGVAQIDGTVNARDFVNNGTVTGTGTLNVSGTSSGSGTINGQSSPWNSDLSTINIVWDGTQWNGGTPNENSLAVFDGYYNTSTNGDIDITNAIINSGVTVTVAANGVFDVLAEIENNGTLEILSNAIVPSEIVSGTGTIEFLREFTRVGWHHISFPVNAGTFQLVQSQGFNLSLSGATLNVYNWDASTSGWVAATASTPLAGNTFNIYVPSLPASVGLLASATGLNVSNLSQNLSYHDPNGNNPGNGTGWTDPAADDGWNLLANTFQTYIDWEKVAPTLNTTTEFVSSAVSIWDGSQYQTYNTGGSGSARWISPNQSFFLRTQSGVSTSFALTDNSRADIPIAGNTNYFKTNANAVFSLTGEGFNVSTEVVQQPAATNGIDPNFDATYLYPINNAPVFNSVGSDSTAYSLQQLPSIEDEELYMSFFYNTNGKSFTISLDADHQGSTNHIILTDLFTGSVVDLKNGDYTFTSNKNAPAQRFKIKFQNTGIGILEQERAEDVKVWVDKNGALQIDDAMMFDNANVSILTASGQLVARGKSRDNLSVPAHGVYIVMIEANNGQTYSVKMVH